MKLINYIEKNWHPVERLSKALVMDDQWGELSRLDRLDGLRNRD